VPASKDWTISASAAPAIWDSEDYDVKCALVYKAIRFLHSRGGDAAVELAFGDIDQVDAAWREDLEVFRHFLREQLREALASLERRGAA
jgi:hypothetical protein